MNILNQIIDLDYRLDEIKRTTDEAINELKLIEKAIKKKDLLSEEYQYETCYADDEYISSGQIIELKDNVNLDKLNPIEKKIKGVIDFSSDLPEITRENILSMS